MNNYKVLFKQKFCFDDYSIVPIRHEDRFEIMTWRNEQIYHLRQEKLLTKEIFENFAQAIDHRNRENIKSELTFIGFKESKVEKFEKIKNQFFSTVKVVCEIISVKKDKDDNVIEGNPDKIKTVTDHWKFTKNSLSDNPNWFLAEIISK